MVTGESDVPVVVDAHNGQGVLVGDNGQQVIHHHYAAPAAPAWPLVVGRAPLRAAAFQERSGPGTDGTTILAGDGGTGKTQLAVAAFETAVRSGVDLALWVTATSRADVLAGYAQAFARIHPGARPDDAERGADSFLSWLSATERSWIVVLDDVAEPAELSRLWPTGPSGRVIVTTRRRDAAIMARGRVVDVDVFTPGQSLGYLTTKLAPERGGTPDVLVGAAELAAALGHLPLALAQAGAVIIDDGISCADYTDLLADRERRLADLFPSDPLATGDEYERVVANTWSLAADRADAMPPQQLARPLLRLAAVLDANGIPETVLTAQAAATYLGVAASEPDARRALRNLHRLSLIAHDTGDPVRSVRIHALAQRAALDELTPDERAHLIGAAAEAMLASWPTVERDPGIGPVLRANAAALQIAAGSEATPLLRRLAFQLGRSLRHAGLVSAASAHFEAMLVSVDGTSAEGLRIRHQVADCRGESGDPISAIRGLTVLLADRLAAGDPDHPETLAVRAALAHWLGESGNFSGAADLFAQLTADFTRLLRPDHPEIIACRASHAYWRGQAGDAAGAAAASEELLLQYLQVLDPDHPRVLSARHNLAHWRGSAGNPAAAVAAYEELVADSLRALGPEHPNTLDNRRNLAHWLGQLGDPPGAVVALEEICSDYERVLGSDHPDTLFARENLAFWRGESGAAGASVTAYRELLADRERVLGPEHPHTLESRYHLADRLGHAGEITAAVAALEQLAVDRTQILGPDHPHTLRTRVKLADWSGQAGDADSAIALLHQVLADQNRVLGPQHPDSLETRHELAFWTRETAAIGEALAAFTDLYADQTRILGPVHAATLATRSEVARTRGLAGDAAGALAEYQELVHLYIDCLGPDHLETLDARRGLSERLLLGGEQAAAAAEAKGLLEDALRIMGPEHPRVIEYRSWSKIVDESEDD